MPLIDLTVPQGALDGAQKDSLAKTITDTLLKYEGVPIDNVRAQSIAWLYLDERPAGQVYAGGKATAAPQFRCALTIPQGALDAEKKKGVVHEITANILDAAGLEHSLENKMGVWVLITEVPDGNWGAGGELITRRSVASYIFKGSLHSEVKEKVKAAQ